MTTRTSKHSQWPRLRIRQFGRLDWSAMQYEPRPLAALGKELQATPQRPLDWAIGQLLRDLAQAPAALKALNRVPRHAPRETRTLNIAVHYLALTRLKVPSAEASLSVGTAWGMRASVVRHEYQAFGERAAVELDALVEVCIARGRPHHRAKEVLQDLDADMRVRAESTGFRIRAARRR